MWTYLLARRRPAANPARWPLGKDSPHGRANALAGGLGQQECRPDVLAHGVTRGIQLGDDVAPAVVDEIGGAVVCA